MKKIDLTGKRFGRLVVIEETSERIYGSIIWNCKCDCGNSKKVAQKYLSQNFTRSCGCLTNHTNSLKSKKIKEKLKQDDGKRCRKCGKNCYPNYFFCEECHALVSNSCWDD